MTFFKFHGQLHIFFEGVRLPASPPGSAPDHATYFEKGFVFSKIRVFTVNFKDFSPTPTPPHPYPPKSNGGELCARPTVLLEQKEVGLTPLRQNHVIIHSDNKLILFTSRDDLF
jgi:hypothetical protein